jgi:hypothetical protein
MRSLAIVTLSAALNAMAAVAWHAGMPPDVGKAPNAGKTPILLELFTSEGCSSCPPIDTWAERIDAAQPIQGAQLIILSEHVDYWDHDGWKDPFSSAQMTARQKGYATLLGLTDVYTPQVIVDGSAELLPYKTDAAKATLDKLSGEPIMAVLVSSAAVAGEDLTGSVAVDGSGQNRGGDVYVAVALDKTQTDVLAGENNGKKLTNVAVVKKIQKIGKLEKGKSFDGTFKVKLWPGADPGNLRVVAFVQESGLGKVLGAGMTKEIAKGAVASVVNHDPSQR